MSKGFKAHPDHLAKAAKEAHEHAKKVESHGSNLDAKTRGKLLGKGKFGMIVQKAVRPIIDSMITDMSKAMARGHRSIGHGLDITRKNIDDAEEAIRKSMKRHQDDRDAPKLKRGDRVLGEDDVRDQYKRRINTRLEGLRNQGHGPQRHLDPTDDMLKDRLGEPTRAKDPQGKLIEENGDWKYTRQRGYMQSQNKIDPVHGPNARERLHPDDLYLDAEKKGKPHKCDAFSTAFKEDQGEAFVYADEHAKGKIDGERTRIRGSDRHQVIFSPEDAWGPGDHRDKFRGFYIDPSNPMNRDESINYKPVDFQDAKIKAIYAPDGNGGFRLVTMFPEPVPIYNK
ncbi:hypothetical protein [Streptomyces chattanoogensis]|uniref:Uncharacterized protein n=1 Tax=Streptomyces chattanoogensis TaxID=66876 RepID=A0A0N0XV27_9ACTN|nr:hypothetical protein [Streptomyces chattanoogensis]KPC62904.1 hypothetical protein ADL29_16970 [Streptomyces chattanoogensis]